MLVCLFVAMNFVFALSCVELRWVELRCVGVELDRLDRIEWIREIYSSNYVAKLRKISPTCRGEYYDESIENKLAPMAASWR